MSFLSLLVFLPFAISIIGNIFVYRLTDRKMQNLVLAAMSIVIVGVAILTWLETPKIIVVPEFYYKFSDPAKDFGKDLGLKPSIIIGNYGPCGGRIVSQSLPPKSEVHVGTVIELTVSRGSPVGYGIGRPPDQCP